MKRKQLTSEVDDDTGENEGEEGEGESHAAPTAVETATSSEKASFLPVRTK